MQHREIEAPEILQDSIRAFWFREMDFGAVPADFEVMPDGNAEIIFYFGSECSLVHDGLATALPSPYIVGLLQHPIYFRAAGHLQIIGIKCAPWAVYDMLGLKSVKGGVQSFTHPLASLKTDLEALLVDGNIDAALMLIRDWFLACQQSLKPELKKAGQAMLAANGSLPISSVAAAANATVRTLERKFKASSGYTVKDVSGLIRFEQVRDRLWRAPETSLSALAHELGYADQSHLSREFKRYSGTTAAAFAKRRGGLSDDFVAIILSN
ncbi:helix-turn-helix domain-containing protein [Pedobacter sp. JY14-1]|uniref:helix-turn-helix domain-containing protein n=1 Tax=Pedobacter sp. JY14-1 TaxID=3034151 RepID=UPI0023E3265C|nr:helix-turn-helix domain-containing protein [Pedobacter sp. JY14-1]